MATVTTYMANKTIFRIPGFPFRLESSDEPLERPGQRPPHAIIEESTPGSDFVISYFLNFHPAHEAFLEMHRAWTVSIQEERMWEERPWEWATQEQGPPMDDSIDDSDFIRALEEGIIATEQPMTAREAQNHQYDNDPNHFKHGL